MWLFHLTSCEVLPINEHDYACLVNASYGIQYLATAILNTCSVPGSMFLVRFGREVSALYKRS